MIDNKIYIFGGGIILDPKQLDSGAKKTKTNLLGVVDPSKFKFLKGCNGNKTKIRGNGSQISKEALHRKDQTVLKLVSVTNAIYAVVNV